MELKYYLFIYFGFQTFVILIEWCNMGDDNEDWHSTITYTMIDLIYDGDYISTISKILYLIFNGIILGPACIGTFVIRFISIFVRYFRIAKVRTNEFIGIMRTMNVDLIGTGTRMEIWKRKLYWFAYSVCAQMDYDGFRLKKLEEIYRYTHPYRVSNDNPFIYDPCKLDMFMEFLRIYSATREEAKKNE